MELLAINIASGLVVAAIVAFFGKFRIRLLIEKKR